MADVRVQGTNVYAFDGTTITRLSCLTTIDLGSDSTTRIENTCLDEPNTKTYVTGLSDPAQGSLGFNLDPENASHLQLIEWAQDKKDGIEFYMGSSEGTAAPTATGGTVTLPATRSWWSFKGGISTPVPTFEADALVGYTVTLERSTTVAFTPKT
ncbi:phage tail tube protein [Acinetobacter soli]|uniref:phage tail tube protein n=1 Tax=Acinetobacter soli TaxID=487316 RepID=UPI001250776D|nr:phage tail tube protein [Acinetobacter soli]